MNDYRLRKFDGSLYITGFMGTGKSTIGKRLAKKLELPFKDLDKEIVERENRSIKNIFEQEGEKTFRKLEWEYLLELTQSYKGVLALGGGALHNQQVVDHLKIYGLMIYIDTPIEVIVDRVMRNKRRPIVLDKHGKIKSRDVLVTELKTLYLSRSDMYQQAQIRIKNSGYEDKDTFTAKLIEQIKRYV